MAVSEKMNVLIVEDLPTDAELCQREVESVLGSCQFRRVETRKEFLAALKDFQPALILSDFKMPQFDGMTALKLARKHAPDTPFIIVTGSVNEEVAVECMKAGAWDYVIKEHIKRLGQAVLSALEQKQQRQEKRLVEIAFKVSEERYRLLVETASEAISVSQDGLFRFANNRVSELTGYSREELLGMPFTDVIHPDDREMMFERHLRRLAGEKPPGSYYFRVISKNGSFRWVDINTTVIEWEGRSAVLNVVNDITERKQAEEALKASEERYRTILEDMEEGYFETDLAGNFTFVNDATSYILGLSKEEIIGMNYRVPTAKEDAEAVYRAFNQVYRAEEPLKGFSWKVIRKDGVTRIVEASVSSLLDIRGEVIGFRGVSRDITERGQAEEEREQAHEKLKRTVDGSIQAIASIVETRDPYTAGHQIRVAGLAVAIAQEMGIPEQQQEMIRVAGILHDIGKINVPAEILSKPGKLNELEFGLIRCHPQIGRDIVKTVELPWPICPIVMQHHERLDGSGYPNGLSGEGITPDAKILAVADVVEAMSSHRPYRPALGVDKALEEISQNRGKLYDPEVVDACLRVFTERGFKFD